MLKRDDWFDLARKLDWELSYVSEKDAFPEVQGGRPGVVPPSCRSAICASWCCRTARRAPTPPTRTSSSACWRGRQAPANLVALVQRYFGLDHATWGKDAFGGDYALQPLARIDVRRGTPA